MYGGIGVPAGPMYSQVPYNWMYSMPPSDYGSYYEEDYDPYAYDALVEALRATSQTMMAANQMMHAIPHHMMQPVPTMMYGPPGYGGPWDVPRMYRRRGRKRLTIGGGFGISWGRD